MSEAAKTAARHRAQAARNKALQKADTAHQKAVDKAALALIRSSTPWRPQAVHANAKNVVRECYEHEHGAPPHVTLPEQHYMDWCEAKAAKWLGLAESFGYSGWTNEIRTLTGQIDYWEWMKKEVGL